MCLPRQLSKQCFHILFSMFYPFKRVVINSLILKVPKTEVLSQIYLPHFNQLMRTNHDISRDPSGSKIFFIFVPLSHLLERSLTLQSLRGWLSSMERNDILVWIQICYMFGDGVCVYVSMRGKCNERKHRKQKKYNNCCLNQWAHSSFFLNLRASSLPISQEALH